MLYIKFLILILVLTINVFAKSKLPVLMTKQSIDNIRYLSDDGKTTYFQNTSGELFQSLNFKSKKILKLKDRTQFLVSISTAKRRVVVEADESFHSNLNFNKLNDIYVGEFNSDKIFKIDQGTNPSLHLADQYLSYYNPLIKEIKFINLENPSEKNQIIINNKINPYFRPMTGVTNQGLYLYTDINSAGFSALMAFDKKTKKINPVVKTKASGMKIEFCFLGDILVVGEYSLYDLNRGSSISIINTAQDPALTSPQIIYSSSLSDLGSLKCNKTENKIYFIKSLQEDLSINYLTTEVVVLDPANGEVKLKSDLEKVTQLIQMDNRLLVPLRGEFYVISGQVGLENTNFLNDKDFQFIKDEYDLNDFTKIKKLKKKKKNKSKKKKKKKK